MPSVNVLNEILSWSTDRPLWQRDALRRLVTQGELKVADIAELTEFCKASHGLAKQAKPEPLESKHLPEPGAAAKAVSLSSLKHLSGVNALATDQTIQLGPALTVVYGSNAAGKSGYTRILKRACRARGAEEILGNVVSGVAPGRPSASIKFTVDGTAQDFVWDDDKPADKYLARISVFDRHCASVYIAEETEVAFRPLGLDLFDKLSNACEAVRAVLERERRGLELAALQIPTVQQGTSVAELLSHLTSLTNPDDVKRLGTLSEEETRTIDQLQSRLRDLQSDDPHKLARGLELQANRTDALARKVRQISDVLSDAEIREVFSTRDRMVTAANAAEEMRRAAFESQPLPNTGSDSWRAMWAASERFSNTDAYPEDSFPVTSTNARCVLCQQKLKDDGVARLRQFQDFLTSAVQRDRDEATAAHDRLRKQVGELVISDAATAEVLEELQLADSALADRLRAGLAAAQQRRMAALNALAAAAALPIDLLAAPTGPEELVAHAGTLRARANELRGSDRSDAINKVAAPLRELEARQVLGRHLSAILGEIERKKRLAAYQLCLDEAKTNAITRKSSEVTKVVVTEQLTKSFKEELKALNFKYIEVEMVSAGGSRGALYHKLQLRRAPGVSVPSVVSEGEARCLSIASFFAELSTAPDRSAILFDDPVSSLDNQWRDNVAERLVREAKSRQVVVFTHDIVFLLSLVHYAEDSGVTVNHQTVRRGSTTAGLSADGLPDPAMNVKARIGVLNAQMQEAKKLHAANNPLEYEQAGTRIYALLRQAWERGIEEVLLNGVVERYRPSVQTNKARFLSDIKEEDCTALEAGMTKCSRWEGGHDHAAALGTPFPDPTEVEQDISAFVTWVDGLRKRRK